MKRQRGGVKAVTTSCVLSSSPLLLPDALSSQSPAETSGATVSSTAVVVTGSISATPAGSAASLSPAETSGATVSSFAVVVTGSDCVTPAESAAFLSPASAVV